MAYEATVTIRKQTTDTPQGENVSTGLCKGDMILSLINFPFGSMSKVEDEGGLWHHGRHSDCKSTCFLLQLRIEEPWLSFHGVATELTDSKSSHSRKIESPKGQTFPFPSCLS